jgi:hypothetical protein
VSVPNSPPRTVESAGLTVMGGQRFGWFAHGPV